MFSDGIKSILDYSFVNNFQFDPWKVGPRQVFIAYCRILTSSALAVLCRVGCLWIISVKPLNTVLETKLVLKQGSYFCTIAMF